MPTFKNYFHDSKIAQKLSVKRTKATAIVCNSLGINFLIDFHNKLRESGFFFSLIMDETTDISVKKQCAFSIIYYDNNVNMIKTNFFDLVEANGSTAVDLFNILKNCLISKKIPLKNLVGFSSDTTNVMVGEHNSVFALLKKELPQIICIRCSCHMAHLAISKACLKLPRQVEDLLRNVGSHFNRSSLRRKKFEEFQHFFQVEIHKILSPAVTRWLSIKACIDRVLEQYEPLKHYLMESVLEDPSHTTDSMLEAMKNPFTRVYLEFMSYSLGLMTDFNMLFQSEKPLLYRVKPETIVLLETLYANFLELSHIKKAKDIFKLNHENPDFFLPLENIYLGMAATESFADLNKNPNIQRNDIVKFSTSILSFYTDLAKNIKEKFNFKEPIFDIIDILDPKVAQSFKTKSLKHIIDSFPVLKDHVDPQALDNEWKKHALLHFEDLHINIKDCEQYWSEIFNLKNNADVLLFPNLKKTLSLLLVLPFSNASVERIFSNVFNIKTDKRNLLNTSTLRAILATKQGVDNSGGCVKFQPTKQMLECKIWQDKQ